MTADVELPPLPEKEQLANPFAHAFGSVAAYGHTDETLTSYAGACVAHATAAKDAEIEAMRIRLRLIEVGLTDQIAFHVEQVEKAEANAEALRAEVERLTGYVQGWEQNYRDEKARAERLAEKLREAGIQYEVVFGELFKLYAMPADRFCGDSAWASWQHRTAYDVFSKAQDLRALLRDQEEGK